MFYDRDPQGIPRRWLQVVKEAIRTVTPRLVLGAWLRSTSRRCIGRHSTMRVGARQPLAPSGTDG